MPLEQMVLFGVVILWLAALSVYGYVRNMRLSKFLGKDGKKDVTKLIEEFSKDLKAIDNSNHDNLQLIKNLEKKTRKHVQKVGLVNYNPFEETGGNHSFSLALLNFEDSGILITGLHTRQTTRLYVKYIDSGKSDIKLSSEEKKAISSAK